VGLWLVAIQSFAEKAKSKNSPKRKRAVTVSPAERALISDALMRSFSSVSETITKRLPFSRAMSFGIDEGDLTAIIDADAAELAYSPKRAENVSINTLLPLLPVP